MFDLFWIQLFDTILVLNSGKNFSKKLIQQVTKKHEKINRVGKALEVVILASFMKEKYFYAISFIHMY